MKSGSRIAECGMENLKPDAEMQNEEMAAPWAIGMRNPDSSGPSLAFGSFLGCRNSKGGGFLEGFGDIWRVLETFGEFWSQQ